MKRKKNNNKSRKTKNNFDKFKKVKLKYVFALKTAEICFYLRMFMENGETIWKLLKIYNRYNFYIEIYI